MQASMVSTMSQHVSYYLHEYVLGCILVFQDTV